jgi:predicted PurR-regulated permease PerM
VLAILIYPTHRRIVRALHRETIAAALSTLLTVALIVLPLAFVLFTAVAEGASMIVRARAALGTGGVGPQIVRVEKAVRDTAARVSNGAIDLSTVDLEKAAQEQLSRVGQILPGRASDFAARLARNFVQVGFALITLFFILKDGRNVLPAVKAFIPLSDEQTDMVLGKAVETLYATFYGVVLVAMLQGTLGGLAFYFLGLPSPLLWGVVMTFLCIIRSRARPSCGFPPRFCSPRRARTSRRSFWH